jgi:hypothetical protein
LTQEFCDVSESHKEFSKLFQNLQIRTSSEVKKKLVCFQDVFIHFYPFLSSGHGGDGGEYNGEPCGERPLPDRGQPQQGDGVRWVIVCKSFLHLSPPYQEFNLGPLHLLHNLAEKVYDLRPVEYIYRKTSTGSLATHFSRLKNYEEGAAVDTFRRVGEMRAHLPTRLWSV